MNAARDLVRSGGSASGQSGKGVQEALSSAPIFS
jgi:hypothetical protein